MNRKLVLSFVTRNGLANIRDYIAERNPVAADRVIDRIEAACLSVVAAPFTGPQVGESHPGLRFKLVGKYVVYYRVTDDAIWVQRVIHSARDAGRML